MCGNTAAEVSHFENSSRQTIRTPMEPLRAPGPGIYSMMARVHVCVWTVHEKVLCPTKESVQVPGQGWDMVTVGHMELHHGTHIVSQAGQN